MSAGNGQQYTEAGPVREHLEVLAAAGMCRTEIERRSGASRLTLLRVTRGELERLTPPTAAAVLAVQPVPVTSQRQGFVDGAGTTRRLRALAVAGWSSGRLAAALNVDQSVVRRILSGQFGCIARTRANVAALYDELWDVPAPDDRAGRIARRRALARGWSPALEWDDDEIDDPQAEPQPGGPSRRRSALMEDIEWLLATGENLPGICRRLGMLHSSVLTAIRRAGRDDLYDRTHARDEAA